MKLIVLFFIPLVYSELHTFMTAYTGRSFSGIPEFSAVTTLDGQQIYYYDSNKKKLIPRQDWMKKITTDMWKDYTEIREKLQQIYKDNIGVIIERFNQAHGVHTYQRMCGCDWDDETGDSHGFDEYGYDGEDFISLDLKKNRYNTPVAQALPTVMKWNNDRAQLKYLKQYYDHECVYWLRKLLHLSKDSFEKAEPRVSLLQKSIEEYVECHVTGFLFRNTIILWRKNGQAMNVSSKLESGDTLPNGDGTFQRAVNLYVLPEVWRMNQFSCVVEHKSLTETIQKILTEDQIKRSKPASDASNIISWVPVIITVIVLLIVLCVLWKLWKKLKAYCKKTTIFFKCKSSQEPAPALDSQKSKDSQDSLLSTPSYECPSPTEDSDSLVSGSSLFLQKLQPHGSSAVERSSQLHPTTESFFKVQETSKDL